VDRICGGGFGAVKGLLISAVIVIALTAFLQKGTPLVRDSLLAPHVTVISERMAKIVTKEMKDQFVVKVADLKNSWGVRP
jgi:membrane protein required for colicin V production